MNATSNTNTTSNTNDNCSWKLCNFPNLFQDKHPLLLRSNSRCALRSSHSTHLGWKKPPYSPTLHKTHPESSSASSCRSRSARHLHWWLQFRLAPAVLLPPPHWSWRLPRAPRSSWTFCACKSSCRNRACCCLERRWVRSLGCRTCIEPAPGERHIIEWYRSLRLNVIWNNWTACEVNQCLSRNETAVVAHLFSWMTTRQTLSWWRGKFGVSPGSWQNWKRVCHASSCEWNRC